MATNAIVMLIYQKNVAGFNDLAEKAFFSYKHNRKVFAVYGLKAMGSGNPNHQLRVYRLWEAYDRNNFFANYGLINSYSQLNLYDKANAQFKQLETSFRKKYKDQLPMIKSIGAKRAFECAKLIPLYKQYLWSYPWIIPAFTFNHCKIIRSIYKEYEYLII